MTYQEYKIPGGNQGQYFDPINDSVQKNEPEIIKNISIDYVIELEKSIELKNRLDERKEIIHLNNLIEEVRKEAVTKKIEESRQRKIGSFIDSIVYGSFKSKNTNTQENAFLNNYLEIESDLGGQIFHGHPELEHSFHYHDRNEWYWLCVSKDRTKKQLVRYVVDENKGIFKSIEGGVFEELSDTERQNFKLAVEKYKEVVLTNLYNRMDLL